MSEPNKAKKSRAKFMKKLSLIGMIASFCALLYPFVSNEWNKYLDKKRISVYNGITTSDVDKEKQEEMYKEAVDYNTAIGTANANVVSDKEYETDDSAYEAVLNPSAGSAYDGMMGYIEIPCIDVTEPIQHYSTEKILEDNVGHIHGSSLPVGGENTHCVLTGHRGLPSKKIFTDLDKVKKGDEFYIHILGRTLAYKVYSIKTVLPDDVNSLKIEEGKDLVTLVTCTPYGINTHRLLVTGRRVPFDGKTDSGGYVNVKHHIQLDRGLLVFLGFILFFILKRLFADLISRRTIVFFVDSTAKRRAVLMAQLKPYLKKYKPVRINKTIEPEYRSDDFMDRVLNEMEHKSSILISHKLAPDEAQELSSYITDYKYTAVFVLSNDGMAYECSVEPDCTIQLGFNIDPDKDDLKKAVNAIEHAKNRQKD